MGIERGLLQNVQREVAGLLAETHFDLAPMLVGRHPVRHTFGITAELASTRGSKLPEGRLPFFRLFIDVGGDILGRALHGDLRDDAVYNDRLPWQPPEGTGVNRRTPRSLPLPCCRP